MNKPEYLKKAKKFYNETNTLENFVKELRRYLSKHFAKMEETTKPAGMLDSRFTPAEEQFREGVFSCGSFTNIGAEMLRHVGYEALKIHGFMSESPDHAWLKVKNPKTEEWEEFDLARNDLRPDESYRTIAECENWEDIRDVLEKSNEKYGR